MRSACLVATVFALSFVPGPLRGERPSSDEVRQLQEEFAKRSGARLVFDAADLPKGRYHDIMPALPASRRLAAARLAVREVQKLPAGYLEAIGLKAVGIFDACASKDGDGYRPYDAALKGYRYYGIWNGNNAVATAFYSEDQLALTLHHEIFHHVDATSKGKTDPTHALHDDRFRDVLAGKDTYPALKLSPEDLAALRKASRGHTLEGAVSDYCRKSTLEDKAETARYLMSHLPDALVQMATRPQLAGSQRMLHVLSKYEHAPKGNGPALAWFVDTALGRKPAEPADAADPATPRANPPPTPAEVVAHLMHLAVAEQVDEEEVRAALKQAEGLKKDDVPADDAARAVRAAARLSEALVRQMIRPADGDKTFRVRGGEDAHGVNKLLRGDLAEIGHSASRLQKIAALSPAADESVAAAQMRGLRLLARYHRYVAGRWRVTGGTRKAFEAARDEIVAALPAKQAAALKEGTGLDWDQLADRITAAGALAAAPPPRDVAPPADNPYLFKVDEAIADPQARAALRRAQPACVRLANGSGVNIAPTGAILTAGHCVSGLGSRIYARFPDGRTVAATCTAYDRFLDLAVCTVADANDLPFAVLAAEPPRVGSWVCCIGQPGSRTPRGEATGYKPFHVSTGHIRGLLDNPLGSQALGRAKHDAWTYWGHSGCPLFSAEGAVVALHNSWDSTTSMRRAVPYEAIVYFLRREGVPFTPAH